MRNNAFSKACTSIIYYQNLTIVHVHTWMWGWLASILAPGFLDRACLLFVCPITGPLFMCNAADILCRIFSVLNSGPIPTKYNNPMSSFSYIKKKFAEYSHKLYQNITRKVLEGQNLPDQYCLYLQTIIIHLKHTVLSYRHMIKRWSLDVLNVS